MTTNVKRIGASRIFPPSQHLPRRNGSLNVASEYRLWMRSVSEAEFRIFEKEAGETRYTLH